MATDEQVSPRALFEVGGNLIPKVQRIEGGALEMKHAVVFGDEVQVSHAARYSRELRDYAFGVRNGMKHVTAHGQIEAAVRGLDFVNRLMLEGHTRCEIFVAHTR